MPNQTILSRGSRQVIITEAFGRYSARLYVDHGNVATLQAKLARTRRTVERWAERVLSA